jgi:hypothetical protein
MDKFLRRLKIAKRISSRQVVSRDFGNKWYIKSSTKLEDFLQNPRWTSEVGNMTFCHVDGHDMYQEYKKDLGSDSAWVPSYNYIYQIDKNLEILEIGDDLTKNLKKMDLLPPWVNIDEKTIYENKFDDLMPNAVIKRIVDYAGEKKFKDRFDGFISERPDREGNIFVLKEVIRNNAKLIDGNEMRFGEEEEKINISVPDNVIDDLQNYKGRAGRGLDSSTIKWLDNNFEAPYSNTELYRGVRIRKGSIVPTYRDNVTIEDVNESLKNILGVKLEELRKGSKVLLNQSDITSWSKTPQIARNFSSGSAAEDLNILLKTKVSADKVLVDFNSLPERYLDGMGFTNQNEVLLKGKIPSTIDSIEITEDFKERIREVKEDDMEKEGRMLVSSLIRIGEKKPELRKHLKAILDHTS